MKTSKWIQPGLAVMLAFTIALSGCSQTGAMGGGKVATVDGTVITKAEYDKTYNELSKAFSLDKMPEEQRKMIAETVKQMTLNKLIVHTLIENEAKKNHLEVSDKEIQQYKQEKIYSNPQIKEQFKAYLKQNMISEADFDAMLKDNLLMNKFLESKGGPGVQVSDAEVKMFYDKNVDQFKVPERIHARHILVDAMIPKLKQEIEKTNPKIAPAELDKQISTKREELKAKAAKLLAEVKSNPDKFEELAKTNSDDTMSAKNGGDLGFMIQSNIDPDFWAAAEKTPNGKLYPEIVNTQFGFHIIKVIEREAPHKEGFTEAQAMIKEHLSSQKKQAFLQSWTEQQKSQAKVVLEPQYQPKPQPAMPAPQQAPMQGGAPMPAQPAGPQPGHQ